MSGIVALFARDGSGVDADRVREMHSQLAHRGPDGDGQWCDGQVGLGHHHLQTTPEGAYDDQPIRHGSVVLTADVRLDNRDELLQQLSISKPPSQLPDSEVLLAAYEQWGTDCVDHLIGAFAFTIWDADHKRLFCARDHMGVKPLYYYKSDSLFAVATEIKSILALPVDFELNETKVGDFLIGRFGDKSNTYYQGIQRLPPAHAMTVNMADIEQWQYWDLDPTRTVRLESDAAYERRFRELFEQAVECRLRTTDSIGATLSGGLDSSSITVTARDLLPASETLHTFSWVFDEAAASDEREYIEAVTGIDGINPHNLLLDDMSVLIDSEEVFGSLDEPPFNVMHYAWWLTAKEASESTGVLLDGALGDSAIGYGSQLLPDLLKQAKWRRLYQTVQEVSEDTGAPKWSVLKHAAVKPVIPEQVLRWRRSYMGQPTLEVSRNNTLDPEFVRRIGLRERYKQLYLNEPLLGYSAKEQQRASILMGLTTANLEMINHRHAQFNLEPRHPFTDKRLLEFSLAMPASQQLQDGRRRSIIRRSLQDLLPNKISNRDGKTSVSEGFWRSLSLESARLEKMLSEPGHLSCFLDMNELENAYERFMYGESNDPFDARALWWALSLTTWLNTQSDIVSIENK